MRKRVVVVKLRNNGGNMVVTIPRHIFRQTHWKEHQDVFVSYDPAKNEIVLIPTASLENGIPT